MLRSIGIALVEVAQPTPVVEDRLAHIAARYSTEQTRVAVLPTMLIIQIGSAAYEVEASTHFSLQLDAAGRIDGSPTWPRPALSHPSTPLPRSRRREHSSRGSAPPRR